MKNKYNEHQQPSKNVYQYLEIFDMRPIIQTPSACDNLVLRYIETVIFPKNRDPETMSAISKIKMSYVETILYLSDDEEIPKLNGVLHKNAVVAELFQQDYMAPHITFKNCSLVALHKISNPEIQLPEMTIKNIAVLLIDESLKSQYKNFNMQNVAVVRYCSLPDDKSIGTFNGNDVNITPKLIEEWQKYSALLFNGCNITFESNDILAKLESLDSVILLNGCNIFASKEIKEYLAIKSIVNGVKYKKAKCKKN